MAADIGRNFLLKLGTGTSLTTVAAMRSTSFTVNGDLVDITSKDDGGFRVLLGTAGISTLQVQAAGVLTGSTASNVLASRAKAKSLDPYTIVWDGTTGTLSGSAQVSQFQAGGEYNGEQTFSASLEFSGSWTG